MHFKTILLAGVAAALLGACGGNNGGDTSTPLASGETTEAQAVSSEAKLESVLAAQDEATKARYPYRHPKETQDKEKPIETKTSCRNLPPRLRARKGSLFNV